MQNRNPDHCELSFSDTFVELAQRLRDGERNVAKSMLVSVPETDPELAIDLIYREYLTLGQLNESPEVSEYCRRFPRFEARLKRLLEVHRELNGGQWSTSDRTFATAADADDTLEEVVPIRDKVIGRYRLIHQIGQGGSSRVFKAFQIGLDRIVAIKLLELNSCDERQQQRFQQEAELIARLQHPNIVQLFDYGCQDEQFFLVLELVEGGALDAQANDVMAVDKIVPLMIKLAWAVQFAHDQNVIHRDLKPSNVLLTSAGEPKIADFGLAKNLESSNLANATKSGTTLGTPSYMAPEQVSGGSSGLGPATDVYGLGAILYQLLTARPPFVAESVLETLRLLRETEPVAPSHLRTGLPRDLEVICLRCLNKEPERRFATATALANELERFAAGDPIQSRPASRLEKSVRWCRRRPLIAGLYAALATAVLAGFAGITWQWQEATAQATIAEEKHRQSQENFDQARQAIDRLTETSKKLANVPGTDEIRQQALREVLSFYLKYVGQNDDPEMAFEVANTHVRIAGIRSELNEYEDAIQGSLRANEIYKVLRQEFPTESKYGIALAKNQFQLGLYLRAVHRQRESAEYLLESAELYLTEGNGDESSQMNGAAALNNAACSYYHVDRLEQATELNNQAVEIFEELERASNPPSELRLNHALAIECQAMLLRRNKKLLEAILAYEQAIEMLEGGTDDGTGELANIDYLARNYDNLSFLQHAAGLQPSVWWPTALKANQLFEARWKNRPDRPQFGTVYAEHSRRWATELWFRDDKENAKQLFRGAINAFRDVDERFPDHISSEFPDDDEVAYYLCHLLSVCPVPELRDGQFALARNRRASKERPNSILARFMNLVVEALYGDVDAAAEMLAQENSLPQTKSRETVKRLIRLAIAFRQGQPVSEDEMIFLRQSRDDAKNYAGVSRFLSQVILEMVEQGTSSR